MVFHRTKRSFWIFLCCLLLLTFVSPVKAHSKQQLIAQSNSLSITDQSGGDLVDYPVQIARPFIKSEISDFPEVLIDGVAVQTQAAVKQRHDDGSVKHAIISFIVPFISANGSVEVSFRNQISGLNNQKLTVSEMLDPSFDFDAEIQLENAGIVSASARAMLENGDFIYWMEGPVATSIILVDHSTDRQYDMGWERRSHTTLTAAMTKTDTLMSVANVSGFMVGENIRVELEVMTVTAVNPGNNTLNVSRNAAGTLYQEAHNSGQQVGTLDWKTTTDQQYKSFRPIFHATFFPEINKVRVRFIGEISNTETLQDLEYDLKLFLGSSSPIQVYSQAAINHIAAVRWTKEFWLGGSPSAQVNIDHNIDYLKSTYLIPNFDTSKVIPELTVSTTYQNWLNANKSINDTGFYEDYMSSTGGRAEIGLYPSWVVGWLFTGDWRYKEIALGSADLAGAWFMNYREGDAARHLDYDQSVSGLGHMVSVVNRPTLKIDDLKYYSTASQDRITPIGVYTRSSSVSGWAWDLAHQPDPFSIPYLLTGDYYFLEQMYFWNGDNIAAIHPDQRGPNKIDGGINSSHQVRAEAWVLRSRATVAAFAPDAHPEKQYFTQALLNLIAQYEGRINITNTVNYNSPNWQFGRTWAVNNYGGFGISPLHHWSFGAVPRTGDGVNLDLLVTSDVLFQTHFLIISLGYAEDLGFPVTQIRQWVGQSLVDKLTHADYSPYLASAYLIPISRKSDGNWFQSWSATKAAYLGDEAGWAANFYATSTDVQHGYTNIAMAATSYLTDLPNGESAWAFMEAEALPQPNLNNNPKWAITPRESILDYQIWVPVLFSN